MLNGMQIIAKTNDAVYLRLPRELWRSTGNVCACQACIGPDGKGTEGFWDTLAVPTTNRGTAWTVHMPDPAAFNKAVAADKAKSKSK